jgi:hypothetical protein
VAEDKRIQRRGGEAEEKGKGRKRLREKEGKEAYKRTTTREGEASVKDLDCCRLLHKMKA